MGPQEGEVGGINHTQYLLMYLIQLFCERGPYHIETSPLICRANQCTGFHMIGTTVMKELIVSYYQPFNARLSKN